MRLPPGPGDIPEAGARSAHLLGPWASPTVPSPCFWSAVTSTDMIMKRGTHYTDCMDPKMADFISFPVPKYFTRSCVPRLAVEGTAPCARRCRGLSGWWGDR